MVYIQWIKTKDKGVVPLSSCPEVISTAVLAQTKEQAEEFFLELERIHNEHPGGILGRLMEIPFDD